MICLLLFVFLTTMVLVKYFMHMHRMESYVKHLKINGPVLPFIGNAHHLLGKSSLDLFKEVTDFTIQTGTPYKSYVGPILFVVLDKPDDMKIILTSSQCLDKPYVYEYLPNRTGILNARCKCSRSFLIFKCLILIITTSYV